MKKKNSFSRSNTNISSNQSLEWIINFLTLPPTSLYHCHRDLTQYKPFFKCPDIILFSVGKKENPVTLTWYLTFSLIQGFQLNWFFIIFFNLLSIPLKHSIKAISWRFQPAKEPVPIVEKFTLVILSMHNCWEVYYLNRSLMGSSSS